MENEPANAMEENVSKVDINVDAMEEEARGDMALLMVAGKDLQYSGKSDAIGTLQENIAKRSEGDQEALAEEYFKRTIGGDVSKNKFAYPVYQALKGTAFAKKFYELEDERLREDGYPGFTL
jgi:hypothetical protein